MRHVSMLLVLGLWACGKDADPPQQQSPTQTAAPASVPRATMPGKPAATQMAMMEVPDDKQQLERMLAMGYTVHENHLHSPGVKECPFDMGGGVVQ